MAFSSNVNFFLVSVKSKSLLKSQQEHFGVMRNIQFSLLELLDERTVGNNSRPDWSEENLNEMSKAIVKTNLP